MIVFVQAQDGVEEVGSDTNVTNTWAANTVTGNCAIVCVFWKNNTTISSVTDSQGNTYVDCGAGRLARPTDGYLQILGAKNIIGGTTPTVTVTFAAAVIEKAVALVEYSGANTDSLFDSITATGTATTGSSVTSGNLAPGITNGAVLAFAVGNPGSAGAPTAGAKFTIRVDGPTTFQGAQNEEDRIFTSSVGTITASLTFTGAITKAGIIACSIKGYSASFIPNKLRPSIFVPGLAR